MADLVMMVDTADQGGKAWHQLSDFLKDVVRRTDFGIDRTRVGFIDFDESARITSPLDGAKTMDKLFDIIVGMSLYPGSANIYSAIWVLHHAMLNRQYGDRPDVVDVAVLITDNGLPANMARNITITGAQQAREAGIGLLVVGIGPRVNLRDLADIAGDANNVVLVESYQVLRNLNIIYQVLGKINNISKYLYVHFPFLSCVCISSFPTYQ